MARFAVELLVNALGQDATLRQSLTLLTVAAHPEGIALAALEPLTDSAQGTVSRNLKFLRKRSLVAFKLDAETQRKRLAVLTDQGRHVVHAMTEAL